jgi:hypothetical protein
MRGLKVVDSRKKVNTAAVASTCPGVECTGENKQKFARKLEGEPVQRSRRDGQWDKVIHLNLGKEVLSLVKYFG